MKRKYIAALLLLVMVSGNNQKAASSLFPAGKAGVTTCHKTVWDKNNPANTIITLHDEFFNVLAGLQ